MPKRAKDASERNTRGVEAVDRALQILNCFTSIEPAHSLAELSNRTGLYKSTILRLINSLEDGGLIRRDNDKRYRLGAKLMQWGSVYQNSFRLDQLIRPVLLHLAQNAGESASFFRREGNSRICLFREESTQNVRDQIREGDILSLDFGAAGRLLTNFSATSSAIDRMKLMGNLPYISIGERDESAAGIAAPVFSTNDEFIGALALSGAATRFTTTRVQEMASLLLKAAQELSGVLGGRTAWH